MNAKTTWFVMTDSGAGSLNNASFGPIIDLSHAKLTAGKLTKRGVRCEIKPRDEAKELDQLGVHELEAKYPNGIDA